LKSRAVVLGAGSAGLTAAYYLIKEGYQVEIVERESFVGGLSGSFYWESFILDYGPHAFHVKKGEILNLVKELFKDSPEDIIYQNRSELLLLKDKYFKYPIQFYELFFKLNPFFSFHLLFDFLMSSLIYRYIAVPDDNFESWCIKRFGKSLYQLCFGNYTKKVWGIPPSLISPKFAAKKIHKLNLKDILHKLLGGKGEEQETYWKDLLYPKKGIGQLFARMKEKIEKEGGILHNNAVACSLQIKDNNVAQVMYDQGGDLKCIPCDLVISSIPLPGLIKLLNPKPSDFVFYINKLLSFKSLILVNLILDTPRATKVHWVYLVDKFFQFNRFTEQKNMSEDIAPKNKTVLTFEKSCNYMDDIWNSSDESLYKSVLDEIKRIRLINKYNIEKYRVIRIRNAYPVYDLEFCKNLRVVLDYLSNIPNLYSIGRQGLFLQNDMYDSMEMGRLAVDCLNHKQMKSSHWYNYMLEYWDI